MSISARNRVAMTLAGALIVVGCGGSGSPKAATSTTTTAVATTTQASVNEKVTVSAFAAPFSVTKPKSWTVNDFGHPDVVFALQGDARGLHVLGLSVPSGATPTAEPQFPPDIAGLRSAAYGYTISEPVKTMVAGVPATRLEVQVNLDDPVKKAASAGLPDGADLSDVAPLFSVRGGGTGGLHKGNAGRLYIAEVNGKEVDIMIEAPISDFDAFVTQAEAVLATVVF